MPEPEPCCELTVRVTPRSSRNKVEVTADGVKVWVTAAPIDGQANDAVTKLLAKALKLAPSRVVLKRGDSSREKTFAISGLTLPEATERLKA